MLFHSNEKIYINRLTDRQTLILDGNEIFQGTQRSKK